MLSHYLVVAPVHSYGKGGIAGFNGEQEHVVACVTTMFGDALREAVGGGKAWISSASKTAGAGTSIDIPLAHKDELYVRSHYDAISISVPDGAAPDELMICVGVASPADAFTNASAENRSRTYAKSNLIHSTMEVSHAVEHQRS